MFAQDRKSRAAAAFVAAGLAAFLLLAGGCGSKAQTKLDPKVTPPAIKVAGTLRAGIDLGTPPFGGTDSGKQAGLDVDTAAALAEKLGLTLKVVDVPPSEAATALADGKVDLVFSVPFSGDALSSVSLAGSYVSDAPAFFVASESSASVDPTMTLDTYSGPTVGVQKGSAAYWKIASELGESSVRSYGTLREALEALDKGDVKVAAGDALVGAYIVRDLPRVHFAGQLDVAVPLGVAVAPDNAKLGDPVRAALDGLAADGVLSAIREKWVAGLPKLKLPTTADAGGSKTAPTTP